MMQDARMRGAGNKQAGAELIEDLVYNCNEVLETLVPITWTTSALMTNIHINMKMSPSLFFC